MCVQCGHRQLHVFFVNGVHADKDDYSRIRSKLHSGAFERLVEQHFHDSSNFTTTLCYQDHNFVNYITDNVVGISTRGEHKDDFGNVIGTALKTHDVLIIAHSYGSLFTYKALQRLFISKPSQEFAKQHLYLAMYGGIQRFPENYAKEIVDVRHVKDMIATGGHEIPKIPNFVKGCVAATLIIAAPVTIAPALITSVGGFIFYKVIDSGIRYVENHVPVTELDHAIHNTNLLAGHFFEDAYFDHAVSVIVKIAKFHAKYCKAIKKQKEQRRIMQEKARKRREAIVQWVILHNEQIAKSEKCKKRGKIAFVATTILAACSTGFFWLQTREQMFNPLAQS